MLGNFHRIRARLLGDRQCYCGEFAGCLDVFVGCGGAGAQPHITVRLIRAILHVGDIAQKHRLAVRCANYQLFHFIGVAQKTASLHQYFAIVLHQTTGVLRHVGGLQSCAYIRNSKLKRIQAFRIEQHPHHALGRAQRGDFACSRDALQFRFDGVCHLSQFNAAADCLLAPQRKCNHRHIVYAFGFDDRR